MIVFRLSGEHEELPGEEVKALYETYGRKFEILEKADKLLLVKSDLEPHALSRLALTHEFYMTDLVTDIKNLDRVLLGLDLKKAESFCVRCLGFPSNADEEKRAGEAIYEAGDLRVDLEKPYVTLYLIKINQKVAICFQKHGIEGFAARDPNDRPFFHPLALSPKLARLFLNLARLRANDTVLDPFCGSGSVLIEADLMGFKPIGTDKDREMLWGCAQNLEHYGVKAETGEGDATDIKLKNLDAIVTDPPYARASKVFSQDLGELYDAFLESAYKALKPGGHLVLSVPHDARLDYAKVGFEKRGDFLHYVHKSLTRRIYILRKR